MEKQQRTSAWARHLSEYGMAIILVLIGIYFSWRTTAEQFPAGESAARQVSVAVQEEGVASEELVIIGAGMGQDDKAFAEAVAELLGVAGYTQIEAVNGPPVAIRKALEAAREDGSLGAIIVTPQYAGFDFVSKIDVSFPALAGAHVISPQPYYWPNFLKKDNLINIANQIVVIAILAIGMTMVIITGGIDLSVGSLIALGAVVAAWTIRRFGADGAGIGVMFLGSLAGVGVCALCGLCSGALVTGFKVPPFIVTLGFMLVASGLAYIISSGESIYELPDSYTWLGRGYVLGLPAGVWLMILLYAGAQVLMGMTVLGRYIYAVGGNEEAARLSGVPVAFVILFVYTMSGLFAGIGGIVTASQLKSGSPQYGLMYELYVIAAVVVGGTSLSGGEGRIMGTLLGAFLIAVIQNGMNLTGVESYTQKIVFGLVILLAVLLDTLRSKGWPRFLKLSFLKKEATHS